MRTLSGAMVTFYQVTSKARLLSTVPIKGISPFPEYTILILPWCKQNYRYFVSAFVTSYITRLAEMSAALAAVAFSFMAALWLALKKSLPLM